MPLGVGWRDGSLTGFVPRRSPLARQLRCPSASSSPAPRSWRGLSRGPGDVARRAQADSLSTVRRVDFVDGSGHSRSLNEAIEGSSLRPAGMEKRDSSISWIPCRRFRPGLAGRELDPARQSGSRTRINSRRFGVARFGRIDRSSLGSIGFGVVGPERPWSWCAVDFSGRKTRYRTSGGRQGIGHQSYFPGGLLTTAQPVGYLKPVTG
jgi:hypothetical protein